MHNSFPDFYRAIRIRLDPEELTRRWQVVETLSQKLELNEALEMVRMAVDLPQREHDYNQTLSKKIQVEDPTFSIKNNKLELSVLSASMLINLLSTMKSQLADQVGLAVIAAICRGLISVKLPHQRELQDLANSFLFSQAYRLRRTHGLQFKADSIKDWNKTVKTFIDGAGWPANDNQKNFEAVVTLLKTAIESQSVKNKALQYELRIQREETNILWWLQGEYSRDLNQHISELDAGAAAIVIGKELADLLTIRPGPRSAEGVLHRFLQKASRPKRTKKAADMLTLYKAVNDTPRNWRENWMDNLNTDSVIDLCPVHLAVKKSLEVAKRKAWDSLFSAAAPIQATQQFSPLDLAMQVYQEAQLIAEMEE